MSKSNNVEISGIIGYTIFKKNNTTIILFYDNHDNTTYCKSSFFISDFFDKINKNNTVLILEEPFISDSVKFNTLWSNTTHLTKFRSFYAKIMSQTTNITCYAFPIDVRMSLFPIDVSIIKDETVYEYFKNILYLFNIIKEFDDDIIKFLKSVFERCKKTCDYYKKLHSDVTQFYKKFIKNNMDQKLKDILEKEQYSFNYEEVYPYTKNISNSFGEFIENISNGLLEYYSFLLITRVPKIKNKKIKNYYYYAGAFHCKNLKHILEETGYTVEDHKLNVEKSCTIVTIPL